MGLRRNGRLGDHKRLRGHGVRLDHRDGRSSIVVTAANSAVVPGPSVQFSATGTLRNDSTQDLTFSASWSSLVPSVATVAGGGLATGLGEARGLRRV